MKKLKFLPLLLTPFAIGCYDPAAMNSFNQNMQQINQQHYSRQQQIASQYTPSYAPVYIPPSYSRRDSALQSLQKQQEIDAYNQRTRALSQPQQLNLNHSGTINHNVYGYGY